MCGALVRFMFPQRPSLNSPMLPGPAWVHTLVCDSCRPSPKRCNGAEPGLGAFGGALECSGGASLALLASRCGWPSEQGFQTREQVMGVSFVKPVETEQHRNKLWAALAISARHGAAQEEGCSARGEGWVAAVEAVASVRREMLRCRRQPYQSQHRVERLGGGAAPRGEPTWLPQNWRSWPYLCTTADQGSDVLSGWHALTYMKKVNVAGFWDWSHGVVRDMGLAPNCHPQHRAWSRPGRMFAISPAPGGHALRARAVLARVLRVVRRILEGHAEELGSLIHPDLDESPEAALWRHVKQQDSFPKLGHRVKVCQFMGHHMATRDPLPRWTSLPVRSEMVCLELDFFHGKSFKAIGRIGGGAFHVLPCCPFRPEQGARSPSPLISPQNLGSV